MKASYFLGAGIYFLFLTLQPSWAQQEVSNITAELQGEQIVISYDLKHPDQSAKLKVEIRSSHTNFREPLKDVNGEVGENISPGIGKRIFWNYKNELPVGFDQEITFKIEALLPIPIPIPIPALQFLKPTAGSGFRRGKTGVVQWTGGQTSDQVRLELLKNGKRVSNLAQIPNRQTYSWQIPADLDKDSDYQLRLTAVGDPGSRITSDLFPIKNKIPLALIVVPAIVVVGVVGVLVSGGGDGEGPDEGEEISDPLLPQ